MSLFDTQDLAEISHPDYPGERLIACRNPALAAERARKRARAAGRHREAARPPSPTGSPPARLAGAGKIGDRGRQGHRQIQDGQALSHHHHRHQLHRTIATRPPSTPKPPSTASTCCAPASHADRPRPRRSGRRLQEPRQRRTRLPHHQDRRPGPAAHPPPPRRPRQRPRADLPARLLPHLAPTQGLGTTDIHRRTPTPAGQPRRPRAALRRRPRQGLHASTTPTATRYAASAACSTTWPPSPATRSATTAPAPTCPCSPNPPPTNAAPSTSSTPRSHSPPRSQNNQPTNQRIPRSAQEFHSPHASQLRSRRFTRCRRQAPTGRHANPTLVGGSAFGSSAMSPLWDSSRAVLRVLPPRPRSPLDSRQEGR